MQKTLTKIGLLFSLLCLVGCKNDRTNIIVGASSTPHALILEQTRDYLSGMGYSLTIRVFDDYVLPNFALENGELDANYFQHEPYLNEFNLSNHTHLVSVLKVHFEPMGIYKGTKSTLSDYAAGDKIIVPSDKSNYDRAMDLLAANHVDGANVVQVEAQTIPLMLQDCAFAVINGNYALSSGVVDKCLVTEDKSSDIAQKMANIIAVKKGNEYTRKTELLVSALLQKNIKEYIKATFGDSVISMH